MNAIVFRRYENWHSMGRVFNLFIYEVDLLLMEVVRWLRWLSDGMKIQRLFADIGNLKHTWLDYSIETSSARYLELQILREITPKQSFSQPSCFERGKKQQHCINSQFFNFLFSSINKLWLYRHVWRIVCSFRFLRVLNIWWIKR